MKLLQDLRLYLMQELQLNETDIWIGQIPLKYNNCIVLVQTGGIQDNTGTSNLRQPTIQVIVRNNSYIEAYTKSYDIHNVLHRTNNLELDNSNIMHIHNLQEPQEVEVDEKNRSVFSCNYHIYVR
jgi:uncharacterized protein (DUF1919 family)